VGRRVGETGAHAPLAGFDGERLNEAHLGQCGDGLVVLEPARGERGTRGLSPVGRRTVL
jgi:hypothetical protein